MGSTILTMKTLTHKIIIIYSSCLFLVGWSQPSISYDDIKSLGDGIKAKLPQSAMFDTIFKSEDTTELVDNLFHMALTPMKCVIEKAGWTNEKLRILKILKIFTKNLMNY